jgi:tRNA dimethylallyltransferase
MATPKKKVIVILGPTASGKTSLGVSLAYKYSGEIVSADSRQVYRGMDVGTGKDLHNFKFEILNLKLKKKEKIKIKHHLIDVASPKTNFNLAKYQKLANRAIADIFKRNKLPIIVGGSGLYLEAVVDNYQLSKIKPDKKLRAKLEKKNIKELFSLLKKIVPEEAKKLNESERGNKIRLIRKIEIGADSLADLTTQIKRGSNKYNFLLIGLAHSREILWERIYQRIVDRIEKENLIGEVKKLHKNGLSWKRLENFGLEYKFIALYLQKKISYEDMVEKLFIASRQFSKRQMSWFRRWEKQGAKINWVKNKSEAGKLVKNFLKK